MGNTLNTFRKGSSRTSDELVKYGIQERQVSGLSSTKSSSSSQGSGSGGGKLSPRVEDNAGMTVGFGGHVKGVKQDQDRFVIVPELLPGVMVNAVFDGHGNRDDGRAIAEGAASTLPHLIKKNLKEVKALHFSEDTITDAVTKAFDTFQSQQIKHFDKNVLPSILQLKRNMEKETNIDLPLILPQTGGCTATLIVLHQNKLIASWVGDSRAILGHSDGGRPSAIALTTDHNTKNAEERERVENAGGSICGEYVSSSMADGMIQTLRSLGDVAFHKPIEKYSAGVLTCRPEHTVRTLDINDLFVVAASDGLWGMMSNDEVVQFIYGRLIEEPSLRTCEDTHEVEASLAKISQDLVEAACAKSAEKRTGRDDVSVVLLLFLESWVHHKPTSTRTVLEDM